MAWLLAIAACVSTSHDDPLQITCPDGAARTVEVGRAWCAKEDDRGRMRKHGPDVEVSEAGALQKRVTYADGKYDGPYQYWHPNGQLAVNGTYAAGEREGPWEWFHKNGQRRLHGAYAGGKPVGAWRGWHDNGQLEFSGVIDEAAYASMRRRAGDEEPNGFQPGAWARWTRAGTLHMVGAVGAKGKVGLWSEWDEDGPPKEATFYLDGKEEGPYFSFWKSGGLARMGTHRAGREVGRWRTWSKDGALTQDVTYLLGNGVISTYADGVHQEWSADGALIKRMTCADSRCDVEVFDKAGGVKERGVTVEGKREGVWRTFCRDGSLEEAQTYVGNRAEGPGEKHSCSLGARRARK